MPCRYPCRLFIHLAFTYSIGPSSVEWSELGLGPPFPPMRSLEVYRSQALSLMCEVTLRGSNECVGFSKWSGMCTVVAQKTPKSYTKLYYIFLILGFGSPLPACRHTSLRKVLLVAQWLGRFRLVNFIYPMWHAMWSLGIGCLHSTQNGPVAI
jgi:hypothetical protein